MANNNNNNNQEADQDPEFQYHPYLSTSKLFIPTRDTGLISTTYFTLDRHPQCSFIPKFPRSHHDSSASIPISSSHGLLLTYSFNPSTSIVTYYIINPFVTTSYSSSSFYWPYSQKLHAVLVANSDGIFLIVNLTQYPSSQGHTVNIYSSSCGQRLKFSNASQILNNQVDRVVLPNTGISCRRFAYWLTWLASSRSEVMIVRVDSKNCVDSVKYPLLTYLQLPDSTAVPNDGVRVRMKIGRIENSVGLVYVSETRSRVELYKMEERLKDEDEEEAEMMGWRIYDGFLNVTLDPEMEEGEVMMLEPDRIKCREMPEPIRFDSFKEDVLLSLGGAPSLLLWQRGATNKSRTEVWKIELVDRANVEQYEMDAAVPYVCSQELPNFATVED